MTRDRIRKAREQAHLSQAEVAQSLGVSQQTYSRWERDPGKIHLDKVVRLHQILDVPLGAAGLQDCLDLVEALAYRVTHGMETTHQMPDVLRCLEEDYLPAVRALLDREKRPDVAPALARHERVLAESGRLHEDALAQRASEVGPSAEPEDVPQTGSE